MGGSLSYCEEEPSDSDASVMLGGDVLNPTSPGGHGALSPVRHDHNEDEPQRVPALLTRSTMGAIRGGCCSEAEGSDRVLSRLGDPVQIKSRTIDVRNDSPLYVHEKYALHTFDGTIPAHAHADS